MSTVTSFAPEVQEECADAFAIEKHPIEEAAAPKGISEAKRLANQLNAKKSTGPKSEAGKKRSRKNSLKHGLTGAGVVLPEDAERTLPAEIALWTEEINPVNDVERRLVETLVISSRRIRLAADLEAAMRRDRAWRAESSWDQDRAAEAFKLAANLNKTPAETVAEMSSSFHGCTWLINCWTDLANALELKGEWTEDQRLLALNLLGVHPANRECSTDLPPDSTAEHQYDVVMETLEHLEEVRDAEMILDEKERRATARGEMFDVSDDAERLRKYDGANTRLFFRVLGHFHRHLQAFRKKALAARDADAEADDPPRREPRTVNADASPAAAVPSEMNETAKFWASAGQALAEIAASKTAAPAAPAIQAAPSVPVVKAVPAAAPVAPVLPSPTVASVPAAAPAVVKGRRDRRNRKRRR